MPKAIWKGKVIAETDKHEVVEGNVYFPPEAVNREYLQPTRPTRSAPGRGRRATTRWWWTAGEQGRGLVLPGPQGGGGQHQGPRRVLARRHGGAVGDVPPRDRGHPPAGIEVPLICGAMYPCSNPELVAAVSEAGGIGIVQPISLVYVHGHEFREGLRLIRSLTAKPIGMNAHRSRSRRSSTTSGCALVDQSRSRRACASSSPRSATRAGWWSGARRRRHRLPRRDRAEVGQKGARRRGGRPDRREQPRRRPRRAAKRRGARSTSWRDLGVPVVCAGGIGDAADFVARAAAGLRRRADGHALHRHDRVPAHAGLQAGDPRRPTRTTSCSLSGSPACRSR